MFEKYKQKKKAEKIKKEHDENVMLCLEQVEWVRLTPIAGETLNSWDYWLHCPICDKNLGGASVNTYTGTLGFATQCQGGDRRLFWKYTDLHDHPPEVYQKFRQLLLEKFPDADEVTDERIAYLERQAAGQRRYDERLERQFAREKAAEAAQPKCPNCKSTNIRPISLGKRVVSTELLGMASPTIGKSYECLDCKYKW